MVAAPGRQASLARECLEPGRDLVGREHCAEWRSRDAGVRGDERAVDANDEVQVTVGQPAPDPFHVTVDALERVFGRHPAVRCPGLPAVPEATDLLARAQLMDDRDTERSDDQLGDRAAAVRHDIRSDRHVRGQAREHPDHGGQADGTGPDGSDGRRQPVGSREGQTGAHDERQHPDEDGAGERVRAGIVARDESRQERGLEDEECEPEAHRDQRGTDQRPDGDGSEAAVRSGRGGQLHAQKTGTRRRDRQSPFRVSHLRRSDHSPDQTAPDRHPGWWQRAPERPAWGT